LPDTRHDSLIYDHMWHDTRIRERSEREACEFARECVLRKRMCSTALAHMLIYDMTHSSTTICDMTREFAREAREKHANSRENVFYCISTHVVRYVTWLTHPTICDMTCEFAREARESCEFARECGHILSDILSCAWLFACVASDNVWPNALGHRGSERAMRIWERMSPNGLGHVLLDVLSSCVISDNVWPNALGHRGAERVMRIRENSERVMRIRKRSERVMRIRERMCSTALGHILSYVLSCVWLFACVTWHARMHESRHTYEWVMWIQEFFAKCI